MGFKVNLFLAFCLVSGYLFENFQMKALFVNLAWFTLIYMNFKIWRFTSQFPGGGVASISRNLFHTAASFHRELSEMSAKFGDKFITWVGVERFVVVSKLSDVQAVLGVTQDASLMANYQQMWPWLGGDDVVKAEGFSAEHLVAALVQGPFRQLTQSNAFIKSLNKRIEAMCQHVIDGDVIDVQPMIRSMTFDVVFGLAVGGAPSTSERRELFEAGEKLCQMADQQTYSGWKQNKWLTNVLGEQSRVEKLRSVLARSVRRALSSRRDESGREVSCLLDALAASKALSEDEIASTIVGFIVLGYDRLASGSCLAILELSKQPSTQQIIRKETKQLQTHEALESFLLETQRLYPATSCIAKWITEGVSLAGFFIPPNASVFVYLQGIGRDAQRFETPEKFDMQRANLMDTFGGQNYEHNLPTTLMKALVGNLLEKFQLTSADKTSTKLGSGLSLRPREVRVAVASQPTQRGRSSPLDVLKLPYEFIYVKYYEGETLGDEFARLNPQRELPVIDDDGFLLSEHVVIMQYICDKYAPDSPLYPSDPQLRAIVNHRMVFNTTFFYSAVAAHIVAPMFFDYPQTEKGAMRLNMAVGVFEEYMKRLGKKNVASDHVTVADISLACSMTVLEAAKFDLAPFPLVAKWYQTFKLNNPAMWQLAQAALDEVAAYAVTPPDMSKMNHPLHPMKEIAKQ